jgi:gamma-glutamylcyclotransferase (GGCT)/AIG2-like uncharacterized protein YtfP
MSNEFQPIALEKQGGKTLSLLKVFVYGTLKPGESNYPFYCEGKVIEEIKAYIQGQLYNLPVGYPAMIKGNNLIEGYLLTFADPNVLTELDVLESYDPKRSPSENEYYRQIVPIYDQSGNSLGEAWAYFMTLEKVTELGGTLYHHHSWTGKLATG